MNEVDFALARRLLCACNLAYGVTAASERSQTLDVVPPVLPSLPIIEDMQRRSCLQIERLHGYQSQDRGGIDALLCGETDDTVILAFRGTLPVRLAAEPSRLWQIVNDWMNNANVALIDGKPFGLAGSVHAGFVASLDHLWNGTGGLTSVLRRIRHATSNGNRFFITGHSKGGALASLAALRLAASGEEALKPHGVYTFAAPRAGNHAFAAAFQRAFPASAWRFEFQDDIVPQLPPAGGRWFGLKETLGNAARSSRDLRAIVSAFPWSAGLDTLNKVGGYESAGRLLFIDWHGNLIEGDTPELQATRTRRLARALLTAVSDIGKAHLPMRGYGYMNFLETRA